MVSNCTSVDYIIFLGSVLAGLAGVLIQFVYPDLAGSPTSCHRGYYDSMVLLTEAHAYDLGKAKYRLYGVTNEAGFCNVRGGGGAHEPLLANCALA